MSDTMTFVTVHTACGEAYHYAHEGETLSTSTDVRADYRGGLYFAPSTLRFFGSRNFKTVAPGVSVELQANAPGNRYRVMTWTDTPSGLQPWYGCWHATRAEAVRCAQGTASLYA